MTKSTQEAAEGDALPMLRQASLAPVRSDREILAEPAEVEQGLSSFEKAYKRAHGKKRLVTEWFEATLTGNKLTPRRGCTRKTKTLGLDDEKSVRESSRFLTANVGDRLHLHGASVDQIAMATVTAIRVDGWNATLFVSIGPGDVNDGAVWLMRLAK